MLDLQNRVFDQLKERVVIRQDAYGVCYVHAETEADLYFAQGYVTAGDRLWQMDLLRRTGRGELAEIFGRRMLPADRRHRLFGFTRIAEATWQHLGTSVRNMLASYAQGVNACINRCAIEGYPEEFGVLRYAPRAWSPVDTLIVGKVMAERLSHSWLDDVARVTLTDIPPDRLRELLPIVSPLDEILSGSDAASADAINEKWREWAQYSVLDSATAMRAVREIQLSLGYGNESSDERAASNSWVVSGARSASGKPMLANDPHLAPSIPCIWHNIHLATPLLRVSGSTIPGIPGVLIGHNQHVAWGITNALADVQDVYVEKFDPDRPGTYQTLDGWRAADVYKETISVRGASNAQEQERVPLTSYVTRHGPVMYLQESMGLAVRWTALEGAATELEALYKLNRARNCQEVVAALADYEGPVQSFVFGDCDGSIGFHYAGKVPIRPSGEGLLPYDGAAGEGEWQGFVPFEHLPQLLNPPEGVIVIANNRLMGTDYPYFLANDWEPPYRASQIRALLNAEPKHTVQTFQAIQGDTFSISGACFAREIARCVYAEGMEDANGKDTDGKEGADNSREVDREWLETVHLLEHWDGQVTASCRAAPIVAEMRGEFRRRLLVGALGPERAALFRWRSFPTLMDKIVRERPAAWLPTEFKRYSDLAYACCRHAVNTLSLRLGPERGAWTWEAYEAGHFAPHPLAHLQNQGARFQMPHLRAQGSASAAGPTVNAGVRVSMRFVADLADWDKTLQGIPFGQSGNPRNAHWRDQMDSWFHCSTPLFPFSDAAVSAQTVETLILHEQHSISLFQG